MSLTNTQPNGREAWRAIPLIKNQTLENCWIKIVGPEIPGKNINENFGAKAKKIVSYSCMQMFVLKSDTHVRSIKFHRKVRKSIDKITGTFHLATIGHFFTIFV